MPGLALGPIPGHPLRHGAPGDLEAFGDAGLRPAIIDDELCDQPDSRRRGRAQRKTRRPPWIDQV